MASAVTLESPADASPSESWFSRLLGLRGRRQQQAEDNHESLLAACGGDDFTDLDQLGFLQTGLEDIQGRQVVIIAAKLYPATVVQRDRVLRYFCHRMQQISHAPYVLVWLHTQASYWHNCPSALWLWSQWERLPERYRLNLVKVHLLHCDLSLWLTSLWLAPLWSAQLWAKINWVSRVEFLWDVVDQATLKPRLPAYVVEHDTILEEQPLSDFGVVASKEMVDALPGAPAPPL